LLERIDRALEPRCGILDPACGGLAAIRRGLGANGGRLRAVDGRPVVRRRARRDGERHDSEYGPTHGAERYPAGAEPVNCGWPVYDLRPMGVTPLGAVVRIVRGMTGREALLDAFDRLFLAAASKLQVTVTPEERAEAKAQFAERFAAMLDLTGRLESPALPAEVLDEMEGQIARLSPVELAGVLAAIPLAQQGHEMLRSVAFQHAQQKMLEHLASQADTRYGGN
jgi:hypothetical protein